MGPPGPDQAALAHAPEVTLSNRARPPLAVERLSVLDDGKRRTEWGRTAHDIACQPRYGRTQRELPVTARQREAIARRLGESERSRPGG